MKYSFLFCMKCSFGSRDIVLAIQTSDFCVDLSEVQELYES